MTRASRPTAAEYSQAFLAIEGHISKKQKALLKAHYKAPGRVVTAGNLAKTVGNYSYRMVNSTYSRLGRRLRDALGLSPTHGKLDTLCAFVPPHKQSNTYYLLVMRDEVARALELLGWV